MEFEGIIVKDNPGLCRCCLSEGCYKDLSTEYIWMGESEVYADMLMECFDISISQHNDGPNGSSRLICEVCITRLRDACNFKKQVLESEKKFIDMLSRGELRSNVITYEQPMKEEIQVETVLTTDDEGLVEYLEDDVDYLGNNDDETNKERQKGETITTIVLQEDSPSRLKQTASRTEKKKTVKKAVIKEGKIVKEKIENTPKNRSWKPLRRNILEILRHTTVVPFKQEKQNYLNSFKCLLCMKQYVKPSDLREHYNEKHNYFKIKDDCLWDHRGFVNIDITELNCKYCNIEVEDMDELIDHIVEDHDSNYDRSYEKCFIPYKLTDGTLTCFLCGKEFNSFNPLAAHTLDEHAGDKQHLCELCGKGFVLQQSLACHMKAAHFELETHKCRFCGDTFRTEYRKRSHENKVHQEKTIKCPKCPELFASLILRKCHLRSVHKEGRVNCELCEKNFFNKSRLMVHMKSAHLKQKDVQCLLCNKRFSAKRNLKLHMETHSEERPHECSVCKKRFRTRSNLRTHERIHSGDRRFSCNICDTTFVQSASLKYHMDKHFLDELLFYS